MHKDQIKNDILSTLGKDNQELKVSLRLLFEDGWINYKHARGCLIVKRFWIERKKNDSRTNLDIMDFLSIEYDVTLRHVKYLLKSTLY